jgi:hypothetical protein
MPACINSVARCRFGPRPLDQFLSSCASATVLERARECRSDHAQSRPGRTHVEKPSDHRHCADRSPTLPTCCLKTLSISQWVDILPTECSMPLLTECSHRRAATLMSASPRPPRAPFLLELPTTARSTYAKSPSTASSTRSSPWIVATGRHLGPPSLPRASPSLHSSR